MAFSDNNPTFKYVKISGLNIIHEGISYRINDIYSSSKYFYWDKNKSPNELITSNIRLTESVSCFLICMNDRGIHTEVNHDELIYNFGGYTSGGGGGDVSKTEFNALKVQVDENKSAYMNVSQAVEGINQVIGETEELEDGTVIKNINSLKQTSDSMDLKIQELNTKISDEYEELRDMCSDSLVDLLASISTLKIDFEYFAEEDEELSEEGKDVITTDIEDTQNKLNTLKGIVDGVLIILNEGERFEEYADLNSAFTDMDTDVTNMLSIISTAISDGNISSDDITTVILAIGTATQKLNILKATVDEIMTLGLGGTIYDSYSQIHIDNERIRTTVKETETIIYGALKASVPEYYSSTSTETLIGGGWQDTPPPWEGGRYIWQRLRHEYASGQISYSKAVCLAGAKGDKGEDGSSVKILGSYDTYEELIEAHPLDNENGDGYLINGDLYIWTGTQFESVGRIKGENGSDAHIHIKYSNDGGLTFTGNNGEDSGLYMGVYSDFSLTDSSDVNDYTWSLIKGEDGKDGLNGIDGINGEDGISIIWKGTATEHPSDPENGWAYYDSAQGKSFVYQDGAWYQMTVDGKDGVDGNDGANGLSIEYKGELSSPPSSPQKNWTYKDMDNGIVYIYTGIAWEVLTYDGSDGADGANGADGKSVFVTYNDSETTPTTPTGDGTTDGWHTTCRNTSIWMSQKIASSANEGAWGTPIRMKGIDGADGNDGANGVNGEDGVSIVFKGEFEEHPSDPENGWAYYNSIQKKSYVYQSGTWYQMTIDGADGIKGNDGADGLSIVWRGESSTPPTRPEKNWVYRDTDNGIVYIYNGSAWEAMTYDGSDGVNGADGKDGLPIVWKGELATPPDDAVENWIYRDTDDGIIYIYTGEEWEVMTIDGVDGVDGKDGEVGANGSSLLIFTTDYSTTQTTIDAWSEVGYRRNWVVKEDISNVQAEDKALLKVHNTDKESDAFIIIKVNSVNADTSSVNATSYGLLDRGENGNDGMSVFITYNDSLSKPDLPTGDGTTDGWHTNATDETRWMSQKVASSAEEGTWGEPIKIKGEDGSSVKILGAYDSLEELLAEHPSESNQNGDGYLINGDLYVWDGDEFLNVGRIKGEDGEDGISMYFHVKYSNDGGLTFTANNGETEGIYIGTYADREEIDSTDVTKYTWVKLKGQSLVKSTPEWYLSTSKTNQTGGSWSTTIPELKDGYYLWLRYKLEWENPTQTTYSTPTVERIYENVKEIAEKQATLEQDVSGFKTTVSETYATKDEVVDVKDYVDNNYSTTTEMNSVINQKANEITSSVSATYATTSQLNTTNSNVTNAQNTANTANSTANSALNTANTANSTANSALNTANTNTTNITTISNKQSTLEQTVNNFKTTVSNTYATKDELTGLGSDYVTKTEFNQTSEDFTFKISQGGGGNLLRNSDFHNAVDGEHDYWTYWGNCYQYTELLLYESYLNSIIIDNQSTTSTGGLYQSVEVRPSTVYTLSVNVGWASNMDTAIVAVEYYNSSNTKIGSVILKPIDMSLKNDIDTRQSVTFTTPSNCDNVRVVFNHEGSGDGESAFYIIQQPCLLEGYGTVWVPHSKELYDGIVKIDQDGITVQHSNSKSVLDSEALKFYNGDELYSKIEDGKFRFTDTNDVALGFVGYSWWKDAPTKALSVLQATYGHSVALSTPYEADADVSIVGVVHASHDHWVSGDMVLYQGLNLAQPSINGMVKIKPSWSDTEPVHDDIRVSHLNLWGYTDSTYGRVGLIAGNNILRLGALAGSTMKTGLSIYEDSSYTGGVRLALGGPLQMNGWSMMNARSTMSLNAQSQYTNSLLSTGTNENISYGTLSYSDNEIRWCWKENVFTYQDCDVDPETDEWVYLDRYICYIELPIFMAENIEADYHINVSKMSWGDWRIREKNQYYFILESEENDFAFTFEVVAKLKDGSTIDTNAYVANDSVSELNTEIPQDFEDLKIPMNNIQEDIIEGEE